MTTLTHKLFALKSGFSFAPKHFTREPRTIFSVLVVASDQCALGDHNT